MTRSVATLKAVSSGSLLPRVWGVASLRRVQCAWPALVGWRFLCVCAFDGFPLWFRIAYACPATASLCNICLPHVFVCAIINLNAIVNYAIYVLFYTLYLSPSASYLWHWPYSWLFCLASTSEHPMTDVHPQGHPTNRVKVTADCPPPGRKDPSRRRTHTLPKLTCSPGTGL